MFWANNKLHARIKDAIKKETLILIVQNHFKVNRSVNLLLFFKSESFLSYKYAKQPNKYGHL
jgi:hypothetical protein